MEILEISFLLKWRNFLHLCENIKIYTYFREKCKILREFCKDGNFREYLQKISVLQMFYKNVSFDINIVDNFVFFKNPEEK
jgi:hypothetical protein